MGNQITGIAPSQILPLENYLQNLNEFSFDHNLGSTRFFKVARARYKEGLVVIKVFAVHDPSLPLEKYDKVVKEIHDRIFNIPNCLPFQRVIKTDKAAMLVRQYVKDNLYDRLSTRPFLNSLEKRWLAFQLLFALNSCHQKDVCHGDIKTENVLITSWNWLLLTDFASYKPTFLPDDNPSDFNYFFDTSRRRTCYLAPERFKKSERSSGDFLEMDMTSTLKWQMDIFAAGCVIAELFTDGTPPFDLSQLLSYRQGTYNPSRVLQKIDNELVRELVEHMIQKEPSQRLSALQYLEKYRDVIFPTYFNTFLWSFVKNIQECASSDEKVAAIKRELPIIMERLQVKENEPNQGLLLILSVITSCVRSLTYSQSKLIALELLRVISKHIPDEAILDRVVPFMIGLVEDTFPSVRAETVRAVTSCLTMVHQVPRRDANIFPDYILASVTTLANDENSLVRMALAESISSLAATALRFLEHVRLQDADSEEADSSIEKEIDLLRETFHHPVTTLLTDSDNNVKMALLKAGIGQLVAFFGLTKANDTVLSHMITYLNDKDDWQLRMVFFETVVGVAAFIGVHCVPILKPLLQQGLSDPEEWVVVESVRALASLTQLGLLVKPHLLEFLDGTAPEMNVIPLLAHPNLWLRQAAVGFVVATARTQHVADTLSYLLPSVKKYLAQPLIQLDDETVLMRNLKKPIPRELYDFLCKSNDLTAIINLLKAKKNGSALDADGELLLKKLRHLGLQEEDEELIYEIRRFIYRRACASGQDAPKLADINLSDKPTVRKRNAQLQQELQKMNPAGTASSIVRRDSMFTGFREKRRSGAEGDSDMNNEWRQMFLEDRPAKSKSPPRPRPAKETEHADKPEDSENKPENARPASGANVRYQSCKKELDLLLKHQVNFYHEGIAKKRVLEDPQRSPKRPIHNWRPKGLLVAHMHENKSGVSAMAVKPDHEYFATGYFDGTLKLWHCGRIEGKSCYSKSRMSHRASEATLGSLLFGESFLAASYEDGSIKMFSMEGGSGSFKQLEERHLDPNEEGCAVDMALLETSSQPMLLFATVLGHIIAWDLRSPKPAFNLQHDLREGLITAMAVDPRQCWMAVGTCYGTHVCYDLRFQLPISTFNHPGRARIRRLMVHPMQPGGLWSCVQGNCEVSLWNVETGFRLHTLWASSAPPLSLNKSNGHAVTSLYCHPRQGSAYSLITAGSDMRIRYWDMQHPPNSYIVVSSPNDVQNIRAIYKARPIEGIEVIQETYVKVESKTTGDEVNKKVPEAPSQGHHDIITQMDLCIGSQPYLITGSLDGVVKLWK